MALMTGCFTNAEASMLRHMIRTGGWTRGDPIKVPPATLYRLKRQGLVTIEERGFVSMAADLTRPGRDVVDMLAWSDQGHRPAKR